MKLKDGVNLDIIKESKFKTVNIVIRFRTPLDKETIAKRVIISNLWETNNKKYKTNKELDLKLSEMYGATFSTTVNKRGGQHFLNLNLSIVDPKLLFGDEDLLEEAVEFLKTVLFSPLLNDSKTAFDQETFSREQKNLVRYLESSMEDKAYYANQELNKLYFKDENMRLASVSSTELIAKETSEAVYDYYKNMLTEDNIDIFVLGNVDKKKVTALFKSFLFDARPDTTIGFYDQITDDLVEVVDEKDAKQSILELAYNIPIEYGDYLYMALQVYNGLLGGFAHSKLFVNVREKESLAYYASSSFDSFSSLLKIKAGIEAKEKDKALALIIEQVEALRKGEFDLEDIRQTQKMLETSYLLGQDSPRNLIEQAFFQEQLPELYMPKEEWLKNLWSVTKADIVAIANLVKLQTIYFMKGEDNDYEEN